MCDLLTLIRIAYMSMSATAKTVSGRVMPCEPLCVSDEVLIESCVGFLQVRTAAVAL